jgi:hypothetical protein
MDKATLTPTHDSKTAQKIEFMFNPTELKFSRSVNIEQAKGSSSSSGNSKTSFKHPNPYQLTISNIMLDTYENKDGERSVLKPLKPFTDAVTYAKDGKGKAKRPPVYLLTWGTNVYLRCFIKSCNFRLTMFLPDGTPVRAILDLTLEQADDKTPKPDQGTPKISQAHRSKHGRAALKDKEDPTTIFQ